LAAVGLFMWTENIMVPLVCFWIYKKLMAGPPKPKPIVAPEVAAAAGGARART
jgi:hypothetical protein